MHWAARAQGPDWLRRHQCRTLGTLTGGGGCPGLCGELLWGSGHREVPEMGNGPLTWKGRNGADEGQGLKTSSGTFLAKQEHGQREEVRVLEAGAGRLGARGV